MESTDDWLTQELQEWLDSASPRLKSIWAKSGDGNKHLSLPQHLADAAVAARRVFGTWIPHSLKGVLAGPLEVTVDQLESLVVWLAGIHDVGKATLTFQLLLENQPKYSYIFEAITESGLPLEKGYRENLLDTMPHNASSAVLLQQWLEDNCLAAPGVRRALSDVVGSHHGIPIDEQLMQKIRDVIEDYPQPWVDVHREVLDGLAELTDIKPVLEAMQIPGAPEIQLLTGIVVFADWVASNEESFPLEVHPVAKRTKEGLSKTDITSPWEPGDPPEDTAEFFQDSFGWEEGFQPRSVQQAMVEAAAALDGPGMLILEAETGVGKTEGALAAAHMIASKQGCQGVYFAAPTMATANGLLERTIKWADRVSTKEVSSLYVAHSKNQLVEPYQELRLKGISEDEKGGTGVAASQWMSGRRRGLLSNVVVGTADQVLMLALKQRYSMLRHLSLAGKIIIFDEIHSYDAYTSGYLKITLEWLAYYGSSVILMTATLPGGQRSELAEAYSGRPLPLGPAGYPRITVVQEDKDQVVTPEPSPNNLNASVSIIEDSLRDLGLLLEGLLVNGGCALVICNTISRAQDTYRTLDRVFPDEVELHHAGFMAHQRSAREDQLREQLGPGAHRGSGRPYRKIIVATQVAEQSLDIDADVLVTDLAPMDLIIQRIGRLHRHQRPEADRPETLREPRVFIRGVDNSSGVPEIDSGAQAIYDPKILLSTLLHLPGRFRRPEDTSWLVEDVYRENQRIPGKWEELWQEALQESRSRRDRACARSKTFRIPSAFDPVEFADLFDSGSAALSTLSDEERGAAQVRDADPMVEVVLIQKTDDGYQAAGETGRKIVLGNPLEYAQALRLAVSTVRLPVRMTRWDDDFVATVEYLEKDTPTHWQDNPLLRGYLALLLNHNGEAVVGRFRVRYSSELGIETEIIR